MLNLAEKLIIELVVCFIGVGLFSYEIAPLFQMKIFPVEELKKRQRYAIIAALIMIGGIIAIFTTAFIATH